MKTLEPIRQHPHASKEQQDTEQYIRDMNIHFQTLCQELEKRIKALENALAKHA